MGQVANAIEPALADTARRDIRTRLADTPEPGSVRIVPDRADPRRLVGKSISRREH
jgi:hypothetical protein